MTNSRFFDFIQNINDKSFLLILLGIQVLFLFQGIDFADEGFHAAFYQQIFSNPESMVTNFMYWLTGIVGGSFYYFFPDLGLIGLRIQGILIIFSTMVIVYFFLKKYINILPLRLSTLILILFTVNEIKEMHYDTLAAFLNICSAYFLFNGLKDNKNIRIALSGVFISLSMFTRLPSIVLLVIFLAIVYHGFIRKQKLIYVIRQVFVLFGGFVVMTIAVLGFMKLIGHLSYYYETLQIVFGWSGSSEDSHNLKRLIVQFVKDYSKSIIYGLFLILSMFALIKIDNFQTHQFKFKTKFTYQSIKAGIVAITIYLLISQHFTYSSAITLFSGISLITAIIILLNQNVKNEIKLLAFIGSLVLFFEPFGSAGGIATAGRHSLWIIFPLAVDYIFSIKTIGGKLKISGEKQDYSIDFESTRTQVNTFKHYFIGLCLLVTLYFSYYYPYFDMSDRIKMTSGIENKLAKGIYTTKERAQVINELLKESATYVKKDDYVFAYDCIPMYHFLTETRPYIGNTWPWLYVPEVFDIKLKKAKYRSKVLPVIILQNMSTLSTNWPQNAENKITRTPPEQLRDSVMFEFIRNNNYKKVWKNLAFEILLPDTENTNLINKTKIISSYSIHF